MKRRASPIASLVAIVAFVFAQLMIAAYACEMGMPHEAAEAQPSSSDCCDPANKTPDTACHDHCQQASKAPERTLVLGVAALTEISPGTALRVEDVPRAHPAPFLEAPHLARLIEPPISIRNCCFRI
jgi:hypothetical protein